MGGGGGGGLMTQAIFWGACPKGRFRGMFPKGTFDN